MHNITGRARVWALLCKEFYLEATLITRLFKHRRRTTTSSGAVSDLSRSTGKTAQFRRFTPGTHIQATMSVHLKGNEH